MCLLCKKKVFFLSFKANQWLYFGETTIFYVLFLIELTESHDETRIEELHKKRNYLAAYRKLVVELVKCDIG